MLKKILGVTAAALAATTFVACSGTGNTESATTASETSDSGAVVEETSSVAEYSAKTIVPDISAKAEEYRKHVQLADYKGIEVTKVDRSDETVSDEEADDMMNMYVEGFRKFDEITDEGAKDGDLLTLSTEATVDGQKVEELTSENIDYELGSGMFFEEFDDQLAGVKAGDEKEIKITYPEDYLSEEYLEEGDVNYNGKEVVYKVNVSSVQRPVEEELSDDWVKAHQEDLADYNLDGVSTVAELKEKIKVQSAADAKRANDYFIGQEAFVKVLEESVANSYPEDELNEYKAEFVEGVENDFENYKADYEAETIEEYLKAVYGVEGDDPVDQYADEGAKEYLKRIMVTYLIADENGISVSEEDIRNLGDENAVYYGVADYDSLKAQFGDIVDRNMGDEALSEKVLEYLASVSNAVLEQEYDDFILEEGADGEMIEVME